MAPSAETGGAAFAVMIGARIEHGRARIKPRAACFFAGDRPERYIPLRDE
jgi:hypothetical protein